jgi:tripartite ATP-independent transporter DctP family solute receptor
MMNRRQLAAATAALLTAGVGRAQQPVRLRISTSVPPSDFMAKAFEQFGQNVGSAKEGLHVETFPASSLFRQGTEVQAMQRGNLEMSSMTAFEVAQQLPEYGLFNRAFLFRSPAHLRKVFDGPIGAEYRRIVSDKMGLKILATMYSGTRHVNLRTKRKVTGPKDLAGIKLRMPSGPDWLLLGRSLGASPVPMGASEMYLAMKTGTIDGVENPISIINANKLYEVSEQLVLTAHMLQPVFFTVAVPVWKKMTDNQRALVQREALAAQQANDRERLADEVFNIDGLRKRGLEVDQVDLTEFRVQADRVYSQEPSVKVWNQDWLSRVIGSV